MSTAGANQPFCAVCLAALLASGCGMGLFDEESGGDSNLPTQGAGPYGKPDVDFDTPADEPYVIVERQASLTDPAALRRTDGGFRIWYGRTTDGLSSNIWQAEIPSIFDLPDRGPSEVLAADATWEEDWVGEPAVVELGDGSLVMYYRGGVADPAIGRAVSTDGLNWTKDPTNPIVTGATSPTVAFHRDRWWMYLTQPQVMGIFRAVSSDGQSWQVDSEPVLTGRPNLIGAFDRTGVAEPYLVAEVTAAGQEHFGLFFVGFDLDGDSSIGYAGSHDSVEWVRFGDLDPVLSAALPAELGPSAVLEPAQGFLFFSEERQNRHRIGVAVHP